jgi:prophage regulatory protein
MITIYNTQQSAVKERKRAPQDGVVGEIGSFLGVNAGTEPLPQGGAKHGVSRSTIYLRIAQGTFPNPVSPAGRAVGWLEAEVQRQLQRRIEASRSECSGVGATLGAADKFLTENVCRN